jgi:hypothetical protein
LYEDPKLVLQKQDSVCNLCSSAFIVAGAGSKMGTSSTLSWNRYIACGYALLEE